MLEKKKRKKEFLLDQLRVLSERAKNEGYPEVRPEVREVIEKMKKVDKEISELEKKAKEEGHVLATRKARDRLQREASVVFTEGIGEEARREVLERVDEKKRMIDSLREGIALAKDEQTKEELVRILAQQEEELRDLENAVAAYKKRRKELVPYLKKKARELEQELRVARREREELIDEYNQAGPDKKKVLEELIIKFRRKEMSLEGRLNAIREEIKGEEERGQ